MPRKFSVRSADDDALSTTVNYVMAVEQGQLDDMKQDRRRF